MGLTGRLLPDGLLRRVGAHGGVLASFAFVLVAEFGDKTQLLTIDLAATFPDAPLSVFVGVVAALALRTGVDALVGERVERWLPERAVEAAAAAVFLAFGLLVLGVLPTTGLLVVLAGVALGLIGWKVAARR
ncbi:TMEM165/GDT1 family protein [Halomarina halobia]|uniref:TMEM165/GDT1 family protein n=1 Tax=Halomarina halobia TaxID=3033386 RepID=A0ABD6A842_9EURY|nr:TMEM165/GDT1 family protein [Halomarina sp. PSR21]